MMPTRVILIILEIWQRFVQNRELAIVDKPKTNQAQQNLPEPTHSAFIERRTIPQWVL